jgi:hypothetical protein
VTTHYIIWHSAQMIALWFTGAVLLGTAIGISEDGGWPLFIVSVLALLTFAWSIAQWFQP